MQMDFDNPYNELTVSCYSSLEEECLNSIRLLDDQLFECCVLRKSFFETNRGTVIYTAILIIKQRSTVSPFEIFNKYVTFTSQICYLFAVVINGIKSTSTGFRNFS